MTKKQGFSKTVALIPLLLMGGCAGPCGECNQAESVTTQPVERELGAEAFPSLIQLAGGPLLGFPNVQSCVDSVLDLLVAYSDHPGRPLEAAIVNESAPNAYALPGGKIILTKGLLTTLANEAELAAVLAHEMALMELTQESRHLDLTFLNKAAQSMEELLTPVQRDQGVLLGERGLGAALLMVRNGVLTEIEADRMAVDHLVKAGYDPMAALEFQENLLEQRQDPRWAQHYLQSHPTNPERVAILSRVVGKVDRRSLSSGAEAYYEAMAPLTERNAVQALLEDTHRLIRRGIPSQAQLIALKGTKAYPDEPELWDALARTWLGLKNGQKAEEAFTESIRLHPARYQAYLERAACRIKLNQWEGALRDYEASLRLLPTAEAHYHLGNLALDAGNLDRALKHYQLATQHPCSYGQKALQELARLELPANPGAFVTLTAHLDAEGYLQLKAVNDGPVDVRDLEVSVELADKQTRVRFPQVIQKGAQASSSCRLGPFKEIAEVEPDLRLKLRSALVAE